MTREKIITKLLRRWTERLRVRDFQLQWRYKEEPDRRDTGNVKYNHQNREVEVRFERGLCWDQLRTVAIHELLHICMRAQDRCLADLLNADILSADAGKMFRSAHDCASEHDVSHLELVFLSIDQWKDRDLESKWNSLK